MLIALAEAFEANAETLASIEALVSCILVFDLHASLVADRLALSALSLVSRTTERLTDLPKDSTSPRLLPASATTVDGLTRTTER
jgi:hypothetical protein